MTGSAPGLLLASVPAVLGAVPAEEVLVIGVTRRSAARGDACIVRIPLPAEAEAELLLAACTTAIQWSVASGTQAVVLAAYADSSADLDSLAAQATATLAVFAGQANLLVLDALRVVDGRWWSYECDDPSCCPPEGTPIPTPEET